jgi:L-ribulose-5-phosphate 4-epimerase
MSKYDELKREAFEANLDIPKYGLAIFTFGNVSAYDPSLGAFAIKPSGVPYPELKPEAMVVIDLEGKIVEGKLNPSTDAPTHRVIYANFKGVGGVVHTHSSYATAWAQSRRDLPILGTTHADHSPIDIPCTPCLSPEEVNRDYEVETGNVIARCFKDKDPNVTQMVLVGGHGPFTWGKNAAKALYNAVVLEELAKMALFTRVALSGAEPERLPAHIVSKHFERKHGANAYYGQKG